MARKLTECECCKKLRRDVRPIGRDADGNDTSPDMCFLCRKEWERGREWDAKRGGYVRSALRQAEIEARWAFYDAQTDAEPLDDLTQPEDRWYEEHWDGFDPCATCGRPNWLHYDMAREGDIPRWLGCEHAAIYDR